MVELSTPIPTTGVPDLGGLVLHSLQSHLPEAEEEEEEDEEWEDDSLCQAGVTDTPPKTPSSTGR